MLKKRFRILRLPMLVKDMAEVEDIVKVCCVLHNMCLQVHEYTYIPTRQCMRCNSYFFITYC